MAVSLPAMTIEWLALEALDLARHYRPGVRRAVEVRFTDNSYIAVKGEEGDDFSNPICLRLYGEVWRTTPVPDLRGPLLQLVLNAMANVPDDPRRCVMCQRVFQ